MEAVDPTAVGNVLLRARTMRPEWKLHEVADRLEWDRFPKYDPNDSLVVHTMKQYRAELQERAAAGDRHARDLLLGYNPNDGGEE